MSEGDRAVGEPERLHPLFLLLGLGGSLRGMAGGYVFIGYLAISGRAATALLVTAGLLVILAVSTFIYWRRFQFRVGESEIRIDSGIINRTHRSIPFDRVQDVDISQGLLARLFGLASVKFETGGSAGNDEGILSAISIERALELRELVRAQRSGAPAADPVAEAREAEPEPVYSMDLPRLLLAGFFNFSLAVFAGLFGLTQTAGDVIGFDPLNRGFWISIVSTGNPIAEFILDNRMFTAIAGLLSLVAVGVGTGIVRTTLREYGFRLSRTHVGLRRRRGLVSLTDVTLPARRAQAAIVGTGPVRERFGWKELRLQSLARDEGGSGDHVLAPLASDAEVDAILKALGWRTPPSDPQWNQVSKSYVWMLLLGLVPLYLLLAAQGAALIVSWTGIDPPPGPAQGELTPLLVSFIAVLGLVLSLIGARVLAWRRTGYLLEGDRLLIRTGWWRRRMLLLPLRRIQSADLSQNFISRRFGVATLALGIAGGTGFSAHSIPAIPEKNARELRDQLLSDLL